MVAGRAGKLSFARLESASPDGLRAIEELREWFRIEGCVS
jgi:hypothetical protein